MLLSWRTCLPVLTQLASWRAYKYEPKRATLPKRGDVLKKKGIGEGVKSFSLRAIMTFFPVHHPGTLLDRVELVG